MLQYIDVSDGLKEPQLIENCSVTLKLIKVMMQKVNIMIQKFSSDANHCKFRRVPTEDPDWNITTMFGVLLDYPVVYWYEDNKYGQNCLSCKDLINYKIVHKALIKSSSIENVVFSFTVPQNVVNSDVEYVIDGWISQHCDLGEKKEINLTCSKTSVNLSAVVL